MNNDLKNSPGFTLVELIIVITIAGILLSMAVPSFNTLIRGFKLSTYSNELLTAINFARSEAIKRGVQVTLRRKSASNSVWESGWDIFVDNVQTAGNVAGTSDGADELLKTYDPISTGYTIRTGDNYSCWFAYTAAGVSRGSGTGCTGGGTNDTFRICDSTANTTTAYAVTVNPMGRARISKGTTACP